MTLNPASLPRRLAVSALLCLLVKAWTALSRVEESLVTDCWEALTEAGANDAGTREVPAR